MKKHSSILFVTVLLLVGGLYSTLSLTSCKNFLNGGEVRQEIQEVIAYNNAKEISVLIQPKEGTGSTNPVSNYVAKKGYFFDISFSEHPSYSFIKWIAVLEDDTDEIIEARARSASNVNEVSGVVFEDAFSPKTKVKITNDNEKIRIYPVCTDRIALSSEPSPRYEPLGVSRDRSITVSFTKNLSTESFLFSEDEIPAGANTKRDQNGKAWAYDFEGQTYLKNISITNADDYSIAEHFLQPKVDGKLLTIAVDKMNQIEFNVGEIFKTVKVTLGKDIMDTDGVKMEVSKSWNYQITEATDEKATINLTSVAEEGSVYLAGTKDYSLGQTIALAFTESANYQFIKWDYDPQIIYVDDPTSSDTTAIVLEKTDGNNPSQIKAICAPRLRIESFIPVNDNANPTVSKNTSIVITFNQDLPNDEDGKNQLENISITIGGTPIKSSFTTPQINANTITFAADKSNMIEVRAGQTRTITVSIPSDFYYKLEDGTKVTYGGNGKTYNYKIDETTINKAEISFTATAGSGTLTGASGSNNHYSIGQEVPISFELANGWKFNGWTITSGGNPVPEDKIKIVDKTLLNTKLIVYDVELGVTVTASTSKLLKIDSKSPSDETNKKDSDIVIIFNKNLDPACSSLLDKIRISSDGYSLEDYYTNRTLNGNTITLKNTVPIAVTKGTTKIISVGIPSDFYYMDGENKINLIEDGFSFTVNYETNAKSKITYKIIDGETDAPFDPANAAGTINDLTYSQELNHSSLKQYNIGEEVNLSFAVNTGYQFYRWELTDAEGNSITDQISFKDSNSNESNSEDLSPTLTMNKETDNVIISAVCYKRPMVTYYSPVNSNSAESVPKNKPIEIRFSHSIKPDSEKSIVINYFVQGFNQSYYFNTSINNAKDTVLFTPSKMLPLEHTNEIVTVTIPYNSVYYLAKDGKTRITPADSDFTWSYKINNTTETKTNVRMDATDASGSIIKVNKNDFTTGDKQTVNIEQSINIEYPVSKEYIFAGWKLKTASNGYTIDPSDYAASGEIIVSLNGKDYCKLTIDEDNPNKAVFTSFDSISDDMDENGTDGYGVTVSAKDIPRPVVQSVKIDDLTDIYNAQNSGISCDSKVYFNFNKPIDSNTFTLARNGSITITDIDNPGLHFENYFTLYCYNLSTWEIIPKPELADEFFKNESDTLYLLITLNANRNEIKDTNGYKLIVNQTINNSFEIPYTVTGKRETKKPAWYGDTQKVAKTSASYDSGINTNVFSNNWTTTTRRKNHVAGSVWIDMKGQDAESGVKALRVTETYYKDVQANDVNITQESEDFLPTRVNSSYTLFNKEYKFKTHNDGILKLDFQLVDYAGNLSDPKTFYVIKDTSLDPSIIRMKEFKNETSFDGISKCVTKRMDSNNQETITLTADNNSDTIKDIFYSIYNSTYNTTAPWCDYQQDFTTEVWWGYSDDAITNKITQGGTATNKTYTFTHDTTRLTYVKIKCTDYVGNSQEIIRIIPPKPVIDSNCYTATANTASGVNNGRFLKITPCNFASLQALKNKYNVNVLVYAELKNVTDNTASQIIKIPDDGWLLKAGKTYEIRPIYVFDFQDCWSSVACDKYFRISIENTVTSSSSCSASVLPNNTTFTIPAADKPDSIYLAITNSINSGCKKVTIQNTYSSNYSWVYMFKNRSTNIIESFTTKQFELPTPANYDVILRAINTSTLSICDIQIQKIYIGSGYTGILRLSEDATPPVLNLPKEYTHKYDTPGASKFSGLDWIEPSGYVIRDLPTDANSGIYNVEENEYVGELSYYFIPSSGNRMTANESYTLDQLSPYTEHKLRYSFAKQTIVIPYLDLPEDCYKICVVVKDKNGNRAIQAGIAYNKIMAKSGVEYTIVQDSSNTSNCQLVADFEDENLFPDNRFERTVHSYVCEYNNGDWILIKTSADKHIDISNYTNGTHGSKSNSVSKTLLNDKWIKIVTMQAGRNSPIIVNEAGFFDVKYVYTPKFLGTSAITCRKKNVAEGANGVSIFCDQPIFAHTMYYPKKLTEGKTAKDIAMWETKGIEISVKFDSSDFTYGSENYKDIPSGYYYTTVVHFADGTTVMSDVKQK